MPPTPHAFWSLVDDVATQRAVGPHAHLALELNLQRPAGGLATVTNDHRDNLLGVGVAGSDGTAVESGGPLTDHWLRGSDLTAIYEPADPRQLRAAVNQDFAAPDAPVAPGDEIAFFPPVTGG
jgi:hypothetical protein